MPVKQRRALAVGICLALVLILGKSVEKLSAKEAIVIVADNFRTTSSSECSPGDTACSQKLYDESIWREFEESIRGEGESGDFNLSEYTEYIGYLIGRNLGLDTEEFTILASTGESYALSELHAPLVAASTLVDLNNIKVSLKNQLAEMPGEEALDDITRQEKNRIINQISVIDAGIDEILKRDKTLESAEPSDSDPSSSFNTDETKVLGRLENRANNRETALFSLAASNLDEEDSFLLKTAKWLCYFIATVVGIFFKAMWDSSDFKSLFRFSNIKPLLIAPIVFYGVYATIHTLTDSLLAVLIAFQNGFFWQSILKTEQQKHELALASRGSLVATDAQTIETVAEYRK